MANEENLKKGELTQFRSGEEAARNGQKGGKASGEARRRKRSLKEAADLFMSLPVTDARVRNKIQRAGVPLEDIDYQMAVIAGLYGKAKNGDAKAAKLLIELLGDPAEDTTEGVQIIDDL